MFRDVLTIRNIWRRSSGCTWGFINIRLAGFGVMYGAPSRSIEDPQKILGKFIENSSATPIVARAWHPTAGFEE